jgi:hypothetical protein
MLMYVVVTRRKIIIGFLGIERNMLNFFYPLQTYPRGYLHVNKWEIPLDLPSWWNSILASSWKLPGEFNKFENSKKLVCANILKF